jgi:hypothetical protein
MAISLAALKSGTRVVDIDFAPAGTLKVEYSPSGYTPLLEAKASEAMESGRASNMLLTMLIPLITKWDLTGEDEKPLPITEEGLSQLPVFTLSRILEAITEDMKPGKPMQSSSESSF